MKRILITGGSGLIGRMLTNKLVQTGYEVIILSRNPSKMNWLSPNVRAVQWDGRTAVGWGELANGATAIVNLAGESIGIPPLPWWLPGRRQKIRASRVNAGHAIVEAVKAATEKPGVVIQSSGINYYGLRGDQVVTENDSAGDDFAASVCIDWENATAEVESLGVRRAVVRTALVLTGKGGILQYFALPFRLFVGGSLGDGKQWVSWIHIDDQVDAIRFLVENENARGVYNLSSPHPLRYADFGKFLARVLHRPYWFPAPAFLIKLVFGELGKVLVLGSLRIAPQRLQQAGYKFHFADANDALQNLFGK